jgi:hypothetical protein
MVPLSGMTKLSLVRPSRDGDQFHYLWAARRCLRLLSPVSGLIAVTIEGPSPSEIASGPPVVAGEEIIDIGEYYGSEDIAQATLVRYMQLKHSTRTPDDPWTASGLEKTIIGLSPQLTKEMTLHLFIPLAESQILFIATRIHTQLRELPTRLATRIIEAALHLSSADREWLRQERRNSF